MPRIFSYEFGFTVGFFFRYELTSVLKGPQYHRCSFLDQDLVKKKEL